MLYTVGCSRGHPSGWPLFFAFGSVSSPDCRPHGMGMSYIYLAFVEIDRKRRPRQLPLKSVSSSVSSYILLIIIAFNGLIVCFPCRQREHLPLLTPEKIGYLDYLFPSPDNTFSTRARSLSVSTPWPGISLAISTCILMPCHSTRSCSSFSISSSGEGSSSL